MNLHSNVCCKSRRERYKRLRELDKAYDQMRDESFTVPRHTLRSEINDASDNRREDNSYIMRRYEK